MVNIKKKNLRARKGKQNWRKNIIVEVDNYPDVDFTQNKTKTLDFTVDPEPINIYENKDRFKKKPIDPTKQSRTEQLKLKQIAQNKKKNQKEEPIEQTNLDIWNEDAHNQNNKKKNNSNIKAVVLPHAGQSYNPQLNAYNELIDKAIDQDFQLQQKKQNQETQEEKDSKREQRLKELNFKKKLSRIAKREGQARIAQIFQKRIDHQILNIRTIRKAIHKKIQTKQTEKQLQLKEEKRLKLAEKLQGKILKPKVIGNKVVPATKEEIVPEEDLKSKLRHVTQGEFLVRSQFEGFVRRGLIEPKGKSNKLKKSKLPKYKIKEKYYEDPVITQKEK